MKSVYKTCLIIFLWPVWWSDILARNASRFGLFSCVQTAKCLFIDFFFSRLLFFKSTSPDFFFFYFANMSISERIISFISYFMCSPGPFTWPDAKGKAVFQSKALDLFEKMHFKSIEDRLSKPQLISIWSFTGSSFRSGLLNHWPFVALPVIFTSRIEI